MKFEFYKEQIPNIEATLYSQKMEMAGGIGCLARATPSARATFRYKECMKNHAAAVGAHAVDGCGEFMAGGADGTIEAFKCAACNCHRNFHRKVTTEGSSGDAFIPLSEQAQYHRLPTTTVFRPTLGLGSTSSGRLSREEEDQEDVSNPAPKKRLRTKFTQQQKEKMTEFAEKLGWKIQKHDGADIDQFCKDTSVKRHVLKVWIHNNKNKLARISR